MSNKYKMADSVLHRFVQIVQEAFLTGTDVSDHLRMVELKVDESNPHVLVLSDDYKEVVKKQHESMLKFAEEKKVERQLLTEQATTEPKN